MYRKKSFNILFMEKDFQVFQYTEKNFPCVFFQLCSTANFKFSFYVSLYETNCIKIQTISLVLNLSILEEILCVLFTLTSLFASD